MRQAFFITGFNNWGKSTIISGLFSNRLKFSYSQNYLMQGVTFEHAFTVQLQSNDDLTAVTYLDQIGNRISGTPDGGQHLIAALCPSADEQNNFSGLLSQPPFTKYDRLHLFLIEYKWDHRARLMIDNIREAARQVPNVNFVVINADSHHGGNDQRYQAKMNQIRGEFTQILSGR